MIDINLIRENSDLVKENIKRNFKMTKYFQLMKYMNLIKTSANAKKKPMI